MRLGQVFYTSGRVTLFLSRTVMKSAVTISLKSYILKSKRIAD